jgi:hypothetical protein
MFVQRRECEGQERTLKVTVRRPGRRSDGGLVLSTDDRGGLAAVPEDLVFVCEGAQPLIDVWIVHRRPRRAAERVENGGVPFLDHEMPFGHAQGGSGCGG